ncbi:diguanylate cyclase domain-containing protein [Azohydromonas aeria]|uniref:diguanylate cyclase domain-containing protein n=1 Tax=Azohydromonas aeria TaxID=2590212 RepID=UPI0012FB12CC|nr:diguanylate cyclase [Azohydromonas aeria]
MSDQNKSSLPAESPSLRADRRVHAAFALACLALVALFLGFEWRARAAALEAAQAHSAQLAAAVLRQSVELTRQAALVTGLVREAQEGAGTGERALELLRHALAAQAGAQPDLREVAVHAADGRLLASSAAAGEESGSARGLPFFEAQRGAGRDALRVGTPLRAPRQGEWLIPVSRRLQSGDGEFAGVVVALLRLRGLDARFAAWDVPPGTVLALHGGDGTLLARHPFVEQAIGMDREASVLSSEHWSGAASGTFDAVSPLDGVERRYGYARDDALPLLALAGVPREAALAAWREQAARDGALAAALLLLVALGGAWAARAVAAQRRAAQALERSMRHLGDLERAIDAHAAVDVSDLNGTLLHVNARFREISRYGDDELVGQNLRMLDADRQPATYFQSMWRTLAAGGVWKGEVRHRAKDGTHHWLDTTIVPCAGAEGQPGRYIAVRSDVSARKQAEIELRQAQHHVAELNQELARLAAFDEVTGLPNRRQLNGALAGELRRAQRSGLPLSVLCVGVDHFEALLDGDGAAAGEDCLRRMAMAVRNVQRRPGDLAARWSGAEFAVLLPDTDAAGALAVAEMVRCGVEMLAIAHGASPRGRVTASIGVYALRPTLHDHPQTLLERATQALWQAREGGGNQVQLHGPVVAEQAAVADESAASLG